MPSLHLVSTGATATTHKILRKKSGSMKSLVVIRSILLGTTLVVINLPGVAQQNQSSSASEVSKAALQHDGQHDFDFEVGSWKIHLSRLLHPLTGSTKWEEFDGTSTTEKVWGGRANLEQFEADSPSAGHLEGLTLRLYNPESHQWSLYWATSKTGALGIPTVGEFKDGVGEFYDHEPINGRMVLVRFIWSKITANSAHFEQSFSADGGKTWEVNWITDQTRVGAEPR